MTQLRVTATSVLAFVLLASASALAQPAPTPSPAGSAAPAPSAPEAPTSATAASTAVAVEPAPEAPAPPSEPTVEPATVDPVAVATPSEVPESSAAESAASEPAPLPEKLAAGDQGFVKFGSLLQFWGYMANQDDATSTTFRVRRAELKASGDIIPKQIGYKLMVDFAKVLESEETTIAVEGQEPEPTTAGTVTVDQPADKLSAFQDVAITFMSDYADISVGQFKNGVSYEGFNSSSTLIFPERSLVAREYGDRRDIGVSAEKKFGSFNYFIGLFNGTGLNLRDNNNQKDLALRLEVLPVEGLLFGVVGYTSIGQRDQATTADRVEVDARLDMSNVLLQAEYIRGWNGPSDARLEGHGFYAALGYTLFDKLQPVARVGLLDVDLDQNQAAEDDEVMHYELGVNYFILNKQARLALSGSLFDFETEPSKAELILLAQASF